MKPDKEWLRYIRKMLCKDKCFMMEEKTQKEIAALIDSALAEPSAVVAVSPVLDEFMDALFHCDTVKVILTGCGETTFSTKEIHQSIHALRQYQKPTDEKIRQAIEWQSCLKDHHQHEWEGTDIDWQMEPGAQAEHDEMMQAFDLAIQALRQMRTEPDCSTAEWQGGYCLGYGKSDTDDEPCEVCKTCPKQASYDDDKCEWCDKILTLFTNSGKYIPENQPPRNYCTNCGRMVK